MEQADGSFASVAVATIDAAKLGDFYSKIDVGPRGSVTVLGTDGVARVRVEAVTGMRFGDDLRGTPSLALSASVPAGHYRIVSRIDGADRIFSFRRLNDFPLIVTVGAAMEDIMRSARTREQGFYLGGGALTLAIMAFAVLIHVQGRRTRLREVNERLEFEVQDRTAQLVAGERRFADFARVGADWLWETDHDDRFTFFLGESSSLATDGSAKWGLDLLDAESSGPEGLARRAVVEEAAKRQGPFRNKLHLAQTPDGRARWYAISGVPRYDASGAFQGYRGIGRDISDLVAAQDAILAKSRILDAMFKAMPDAATIIGPDLRGTELNELHYELFDIDKGAAEASGDPVEFTLLELARRGEYGPGDPAQLVKTRMAEMAQRMATHGSLQYQRQLTSGRWIEARLRAIEGGGWITLHRDITAAKQHEQSLERQSNMLR